MMTEREIKLLLDSIDMLTYRACLRVKLVQDINIKGLKLPQGLTLIIRKFYNNPLTGDSYEVSTEIPPYSPLVVIGKIPVNFVEPAEMLNPNLFKIIHKIPF